MNLICLSGLLSQSVPLHNQNESDSGNNKGCKKADVSYEELLSVMEDGKVMLIDVREPKELEEVGSIPSAINIPCECLLIPSRFTVIFEHGLQSILIFLIQ